jgi:AAA domain
MTHATIGAPTGISPDASVRPTKGCSRPHPPHDDDNVDPDDAAGFFLIHLPDHVQKRFDRLAPTKQEMFAVDVRRDESTRAYCKERIKLLHSAQWPIDDMVDLARCKPSGFGQLHTETWKVFPELLKELHEEAAGPYPGLAEALSATTWMQRNDPPPDRLLGDIVTTTIRMFLIGMAGLGKTMIGLAIGISIALGQAFCHWRSHRAARVLYIDAEMPRELIIKRTKDAARRAGHGDTIPNLMIYSLEDSEKWAARWPKLGEFEALNTEAGHEFVYRLCEASKPDVIILDNVQCLAPGVQKEEETWAGVVPLVQGLTKRRIGQIWLDHANQQGKQYGTITKGWRADTIGIMSPLQGEDAPPPDETAFLLQFDPAIGGKCRRRTPENWQEFAPHVFRLRDDEWISEPVRSTGRPDPGKGPSPSRQVFYKALTAAIGKDTTSNNGSTTVEAWETECINRHLIEPPPADGKETGSQKGGRYRDYRAAKSTLLKFGWISIAGDRVFDLKGRWA